MHVKILRKNDFVEKVCPQGNALDCGARRPRFDSRVLEGCLCLLIGFSDAAFQPFVRHVLLVMKCFYSFCNASCLLLYLNIAFLRVSTIVSIFKVYCIRDKHLYRTCI